MNVKVTIDNQEVIFPQNDQQPFVHPDNQRTYIPIRFPFEKMGFNVDWIPRTIEEPKGTVVITNNTSGVVLDNSIIKSKCYDVSIKEDDTIFITNNIPYEFIYDTPMYVGGRTMLPLRKIFESIDCFVDWDSSNSTAVIYSLENQYRIKDPAGNYITYSSVNKNTPITVEPNNNSESQIWKIGRSSKSRSHHIMTSQNTNRAMNIFRSDNTCTVYDISGNINDTSLLIQSVDNSELVGDCYIKWADNSTTMYLSQKMVDGKNIAYWKPVSFDEEPQHWILELAGNSNNQESNSTDVEGYFKIGTDSGYITYSASGTTQKPSANNVPLSVESTENVNNADLQIWKLEKSTNSNKYCIRPALSTYLGMNVYGITNNPCTLQPTSEYPDDTSFSIEYIENQGYLIFWENSGTRYYLTEGNGTTGEIGKVYWRPDAPFLWTLEPTNYTPPPIDDTKTYPVAGITNQGTTYIGHPDNSRDFQAPHGTAIYATMSGIVTAVVMNFPNNYNYNNKTGVASGGATADIDGTMKSYGNYVKIKVDYDQSVIIFAHQQQNNHVKEGDKVHVGQQIGEVGNTGVSSGSHLHFQVKPVETAGNTVLDYFRWDY